MEDDKQQLLLLLLELRLLLDELRHDLSDADNRLVLCGRRIIGVSATEAVNNNLSSESDGGNDRIKLLFAFSDRCCLRLARFSRIDRPAAMEVEEEAVRSLSHFRRVKLLLTLRDMGLLSAIIS